MMDLRPGKRNFLKKIQNNKTMSKAKSSKKSNVDFTGYHDDSNKPIYVGDTLKSEWGYEVVVVKDDSGYSGKLVCGEKHSCRNIPYALNEGKGYVKINIT